MVSLALSELDEGGRDGSVALGGDQTNHELMNITEVGFKDDAPT
jgi:hypothetical protein